METKKDSSNYLGHSVPLIRGEFSKVDYGIKKEKSADLRLRDAQSVYINAILYYLRNHI